MNEVYNLDLTLLLERWLCYFSKTSGIAQMVKA